MISLRYDHTITPAVQAAAVRTARDADYARLLLISRQLRQLHKLSSGDTNNSADTSTSTAPAVAVAVAAINHQRRVILPDIAKFWCARSSLSSRDRWLMFTTPSLHPHHDHDTDTDRDREEKAIQKKAETLTKEYGDDHSLLHRQHMHV